MKNYVRDWKNIKVRYNGNNYLLKACLAVGRYGGYYGDILDRSTGQMYKVTWGVFYVNNNRLPLVDAYNGKKLIVIEDLATRNATKICILMYEDMLKAEKAISPTPIREMSEEERQTAAQAREEREKKIYNNYSSSSEYKSGVPYYFYRAKTKTVCAKLSTKVATHVKRTYFADDTVAKLHKAYKKTCMNCDKRASCRLECLEDKERSYVFRYITSMVDSDEVIEFEYGRMKKEA